MFLGKIVYAQTVVDSISKTDSTEVDTVVAIQPVKDTIIITLKYPFTSDSFLFGKRLFFSFTNPVRYTVSEKTWQGKEAIFYLVIALFIAFAFIKNSFSRYLSDLYSSYFRTTVRQKHVKEQLLQSPLPSLLFNLFFVISGAIFLTLIFHHFNLGVGLPFWLLAAYCSLGIVAIYTIKFLMLKFFGWVFQMTDVTDTYIFIVFATNKILGMIFLPFIALLAFTYGSVHSGAATLSLIIAGGLFIYRYFLSFISVSHIIHINFFHFLLYLGAFEILPLLLINKLLFTILSEIS